MSALLAELSKQALSLVPEERAQLAQELLESLDSGMSSDVSEAWDAELADRITSYERGEATLIPAEDVFAAAKRLTQ